MLSASFSLHYSLSIFGKKVAALVDTFSLYMKVGRMHVYFVLSATPLFRVVYGF